jgi:hypothetical protein
MKKSSNYIVLSAVSCIIICFGEFVTIFVLGLYFPGYNQLKDTMSHLGASVSPVGNIISAWWIIMGILMIFFGTGFQKAFSEKEIYSKWASWLILLYGAGEGIGSGAFKADHLTNGLTTSAIIHNVVGGIGVTAILLLPLVMQKVITKHEMPLFFHLSKIVFIAGLVTVLLFMFRYSTNDHNFIAIYKGLWQRLFMFNTYIYLTVIAIIMIKKQSR